MFPFIRQGNRGRGFADHITEANATGLEVAYVRAPEGTIIGFSEPPPSAAQ